MRLLHDDHFDVDYLYVSRVFFAIVAIGVLIVYFLVGYARDRAWTKHVSMKLLFYIYIISVIAITLFPLEIGYPFRDFSVSAGIPFYDFIQQLSSSYHSGWVDTMYIMRQVFLSVGGNIIMFIPLGLLGGIVFEKYRVFYKNLLLGLGFSLFIEVVQLFGTYFGIMQRAVDTDDIVCNVLGCIIGYGFLRIFLFFRARRKIKYSGA